MESGFSSFAGGTAAVDRKEPMGIEALFPFKRHIWRDGMLKILRAKLHGLRVTGCELHYHGSITLDPDHCALADICPLEFVEIWNKNTGARIETYVIYGEAGSGCCILNGAAARTCSRGDEIIVAASAYVKKARLARSRPRVLVFGADNEVLETLEYRISRDEKGGWQFSVEQADPERD